MKNLKDLAAKDNKIMELLNVNEIHHIAARTDKGDLTLMLRKGQKARDYRFILDAVPQDEAKNKELLREFENILYTL